MRATVWLEAHVRCILEVHASECRGLEAWSSTWFQGKYPNCLLMCVSGVL